MDIYAQIACAMPAELIKRGVDWRERAVYTEAILYARAGLTDGLIHRALLATWMPDMKVTERVKRLDKLVARGALLEHEDGWIFPPHVWSKWNPSRADIDAKRAAERERKARARRRVRDVSARTDSDGDARVRDLSATCPPQSETETTAETEAKQRDSRRQSSNAAKQGGKRQTTDDDDRIRRAIAIHAQAAAHRNAGSSRRRYAAAVRAADEVERIDDLRSYLAEHPDADVEALATDVLDVSPIDYAIAVGER